MFRIQGIATSASHVWSTEIKMGHLITENSVRENLSDGLLDKNADIRNLRAAGQDFCTLKTNVNVGKGIP